MLVQKTHLASALGRAAEEAGYSFGQSAPSNAVALAMAPTPAALEMSTFSASACADQCQLADELLVDARPELKVESSRIFTFGHCAS